MRPGARNRPKLAMDVLEKWGLTSLILALTLQLGLLGSPPDPVGRFTMQGGPSLGIVSEALTASSASSLAGKEHALVLGWWFVPASGMGRVFSSVSPARCAGSSLTSLQHSPLLHRCEGIYLLIALQARWQGSGWVRVLRR